MDFYWDSILNHIILWDLYGIIIIKHRKSWAFFLRGDVYHVEPTHLLQISKRLRPGPAPPGSHSPLRLPLSLLSLALTPTTEPPDRWGPAVCERCEIWRCSTDDPMLTRPGKRLHKTMEITMFNGIIHYIYGHVQ